MAKKIIELKNIVKAYGDNVVVKNMNLYVNDNEFITFLGPSGCGKTTTLRMIGGFEAPDSGEIILNGEVVNNLPPYQRPINTVFQRYALFPHLNIFDNVAFGLRNYNRTFEELKSKYKTNVNEFGYEIISFEKSVSIGCALFVCILDYIKSYIIKKLVYMVRYLIICLPLRCINNDM